METEDDKFANSSGLCIVASKSWSGVLESVVVDAETASEITFGGGARMPSGYCATWISGNAPPPPKCAFVSGTQA